MITRADLVERANAWGLRAKAYRVDRIRDIEVLREAFEPRFRVEFTAGASIAVRPTRRGRRA